MKPVVVHSLIKRRNSEIENLEFICEYLPSVTQCSVCKTTGPDRLKVCNKTIFPIDSIYCVCCFHSQHSVLQFSAIQKLTLACNELEAMKTENELELQKVKDEYTEAKAAYEKAKEAFERTERMMELVSMSNKDISSKYSYCLKQKHEFLEIKQNNVFEFRDKFFNITYVDGVELKENPALSSSASANAIDSERLNSLVNVVNDMIAEEPEQAPAKKKTKKNN
jgi:hypothetical protein